MSSSGKVSRNLTIHATYKNKYTECNFTVFIISYSVKRTINVDKYIDIDIDEMIIVCAQTEKKKPTSISSASNTMSTIK